MAATYGGYLSRLQIGNTWYNLFDKEAREMFAQTLVFAGVTTASISDGGSTPSTYAGLTGISTYPIDPTTGQPHVGTDTIDTGTVVIADSKEFVWQGGAWHEFGDLYEWTPTLTKDSVLGADTTFTPAYTSTATTGTSTHSHQISKNDIVQALAVTNVHAAASTPTFTPTTASVSTGVSSDGGYLETTTIPKITSVGTSLWVPTVTAGSASFSVITPTEGSNTYLGYADQSVTAGTAASATLASSVLTGLTSDTTSTDGTAYISAVTTSNKLDTGSQSGSVAGTVVTGVSASGSGNDVVTAVSTASQSGSVQSTVVTGLNSGSTVLTSFSAGSTPYVASTESNNDGTSTNTLILSEGTAPSASDTTLTTGSQSLSLQTTVATGRTLGHLTTDSQSLSLQTTVAKGTVSSSGTGSAVATGGTTKYLHTSSESQSFTANTPTAVTVGSRVATGYATTTNNWDNSAFKLTPTATTSLTVSSVAPITVGQSVRVATGEIVDSDDYGDYVLNSATSSGSETVVTGGSVSAPTITLSKPTGTTATGDIQLVNNQKTSGDYVSTSTDGSHTHNYDKTTSITKGSNDLVDAVTDVTLS